MMEPRGGETLLALQISFIMTLNHKIRYADCIIPNVEGIVRARETGGKLIEDSDKNP